jgi:hypothetical protein
MYWLYAAIDAISADTRKAELNRTERSITDGRSRC